MVHVKPAINVVLMTVSFVKLRLVLRRCAIEWKSNVIAACVTLHVCAKLSIPIDLRYPTF